MFTAALKGSVGVRCHCELPPPLLHHKLFKLTDVWVLGGFLYLLVSEGDSHHVTLITDLEVLVGWERMYFVVYFAEIMKIWLTIWPSKQALVHDDAQNPSSKLNSYDYKFY